MSHVTVRIPESAAAILDSCKMQDESRGDFIAHLLNWYMRNYRELKAREFEE